MNALVTGAAGAIGGEIARQLADQGCMVIAQDIRAPDWTGDGDAAPVEVTVGDLLDAEYGRKLGGLVGGASVDTVIAAHGIDGSGALGALNDEFVRRVLAVNALSVTRLLAATLPALARARGSFVVIASQAGLYAEGNNAAYCASKFALVGWVRRLHPSLGEQGVALRAFCPGCTETPLLHAAQERFAHASGSDVDAFVNQRRERIPIERFAHVSETAAGAIYLARRKASQPVVLAATGGEVLY